MKKLAAISFVFLMLLSICGCNSTKLTTKNLVGTWEANITIADYAAMTGESIGGDDDDLPKQYVEQINNLGLHFRTVFNKDGTCDTKIAKTSIDKFYSDMIDIIVDFYKEQGLLMMYQANGLNVQTNTELEAYLVANGTTSADIIASLKSTLETTIETGKEEIDFGKLGDDGYYTITEKFTVNEESITTINKDNEEEIMYCKLTDKDTLTVNKIYFDFEEYNVDITFKRVK